MIDLDDIPMYQQFDRAGMLRHLHEFPEQCQRAWEKAHKLDLPKQYARISAVIISGMGGSAIGGDTACHLLLNESKVPVWVHRDYGLPAFAGQNTLVIASSYSGNTEETIMAFRQALESRAKTLIITSNGKLKQLAEAEGTPAFFIDYQAPPRAAFPHNFIPLLAIFQKLGLIPDKTAEVQETVQILNKLSKEVVETTPIVSNPAKQLATRLYARLAVIYGAEFLSPVARRWKTQLNENSKAWAFSETFPELNHNAIEGYDFPPELRERISILLLRSSLLRPQNLLRYEATAKLLARAGINYEVIDAQGRSTLAQVMSLILLGDYCSFYLAILNGLDPAPTHSIDFVKQYLARYSSPDA